MLRIGWFSIGYETSHNWNCYDDCEDTDCTLHWLGVNIKLCFIGFHWITDSVSV